MFVVVIQLPTVPSDNVSQQSNCLQNSKIKVKTERTNHSLLSLVASPQKEQKGISHLQTGKFHTYTRVHRFSSK
jgi:hypothetical protein